MAMMFAIRPLIASIQSFAFIGYLLSCSDNTIIEYLCKFVKRHAVVPSGNMNVRMTNYGDEPHPSTQNTTTPIQVELKHIKLSPYGPQKMKAIIALRVSICCAADAAARDQMAIQQPR